MLDQGVKGQQSRIFYLDLARTIAIVSITLNHAVNYTYSNYAFQMEEFLATSTMFNIIKTCAYVFSRLGVPIFLMITGALVLTKNMYTEQDVQKFYKNNLLRMLITTELWYVIAYFLFELCDPEYTVLETGGWSAVLTDLIRVMLFMDSPPVKSLWYMPMILCMYTTVPFVSLIRTHAPVSVRKFLLLPMVLVTVTSMVIPSVQNFLILVNNPEAEIDLFSFHIYSSEYAYHQILLYYFYVFIGYLAYSGRFGVLKTWFVTAVAALSFLLCCIYQYWAYALKPNFLIDYDFILFPVCAGAIIELLRRYAHLFRCLNKPVTYLSRVSFAIYFIHILIMHMAILYMDFSGCPFVLKMLFLEIGSLMGSLLIIHFMKKFSFCRRYMLFLK